MRLFLERYKNGDTSFEIFDSCGYDIAVLGENRVYGFPRRVATLLGISQEINGAIEKTGIGVLQETSNNTIPVQLSIADMQRELEYLRRQVQLFLFHMLTHTPTNSPGGTRPPS